MKSHQAACSRRYAGFCRRTARSAGREIYPEPSQAKADLAAALKTAAETHKRILLDFGGNWCGDCQVLDIYFHDATNLPILEVQLCAGARQHRPHGRERGHRPPSTTCRWSEASRRWPC